MRSQSSKIKLILTLLVIFTVSYGLYVFVSHKQQHLKNLQEIKIDGMVLPAPQAIADFSLVDNKGRAFTKENLKGHWTFLFFGFTNCGMVCPLTMSELNKMYKALESQLPAKQIPEILFITVDPERDTIARIDEYVTTFNKNFKGAVADKSQLASLEKEFHLVAVKLQSDNSTKNNYSIDHSAEIMLINPDAKLQAFMAYPHKAEQMIVDYKTLLQVTNE